MAALMVHACKQIALALLLTVAVGSAHGLGPAGGNRICRFALNATEPVCESSDALFNQGAQDSDTWAIVDVLVWPTRAWIASHGGWEPAMARLRAGTTHANRIYAQSDTRVQLRFDLVRDSAWEPTKPADVDHPDMRNISTVRGGDLLLVVADVNESLNEIGCKANQCGFANSPRFLDTANMWAFNNRSFAFVFDAPGVYRSTNAAGQTIFANIASLGMLMAHELGHLMGLTHGDGVGGPSFGRFPYSGGFIATANNSNIGDAMIGFPPGSFFSNPRLQCPNGVPCGNPATADAARSIKETRFELAAISPTTWRARGFGAGLWFNPREPGQGWSITQQGETIFAIWFTHDTSGKPLWLVGPDLRLRPDEGFHGRIYRVKQGLPLDQATGRPAILDPSDVVDIGNAVLSFNSPDWAQISLDIVLDGRPIRIANGLSRMRFTSQSQTCGLSDNPPGDFAAAWNRASEAGWGLFASHEADIMFAVIMTYDRARAPMWRSASSLVRQPDGSYKGDLFKTTGVALDAVGGPLFRPLDATNNSAETINSAFVGAPSKVGELILSFTDTNTGRMIYRDDAIAVDKPMDRYIFSSRAAGCR
ncbi:hypothetical protein [Usitatibacter palustris]|uniref:Uncharacterized protein n=1 Tax=Usitatibacter palustris TaxID=2732487 RepID=A0A6M4H6Y7_9PROT|nr:hypothetical protein [Usitatibacter palustris]QJR15366.1 hypothetical protein DSM104440_02185 [Usitatibacter palustris]